jgi:hypothetical protein
MSHDKDKRKPPYRSPEVIYLGDAISLTEGSSEKDSDFPKTGWANPYPDPVHPDGPRREEPKTETAAKKGVAMN